MDVVVVVGAQSRHHAHHHQPSPPYTHRRSEKGLESLLCTCIRDDQAKMSRAFMIPIYARMRACNEECNIHHCFTHTYTHTHVHSPPMDDDQGAFRNETKKRLTLARISRSTSENSLCNVRHSIRAPCLSTCGLAPRYFYIAVICVPNWITRAYAHALSSHNVQNTTHVFNYIAHRRNVTPCREGSPRTCVECLVGGQRKGPRASGSNFPFTDRIVPSAR